MTEIWGADAYQAQAESLARWVVQAAQVARLWPQGHQAALCTSGHHPAPLAAPCPHCCAPARWFQGFVSLCPCGNITSPDTCPVTDRVLVLQPGVRPEPLKWESWVQDIGPSETSQCHIISISESSPRDFSQC